MNYRANAQLRQAVSLIADWKADLASIERQIRNVARGIDDLDGSYDGAAHYLFGAAHRIAEVSGVLTKALDEITSQKGAG